MPPTRSLTRELAKTLDAVQAGVYAVDGERRIVFANRACLAWLGVEADKLIGETAAYHSLPDAAGEVRLADRLCPPPATLVGERVEAVVAVPGDGGELRSRRVTFLPLAIDDELFAVLALVGPGDLASEELAADPHHDSAADELHRQIQSLRHAWRKQFRIERLLGDSPAMHRVRSQAAVAAACRANVAIYGPEGSGRRHVALTIAQAASTPINSASDLPALDCAALAVEQINTALSSANRKRGEAATLTLLNVERLPPECQETARELALPPSAVRLIATSMRSLLDLADEGLFPTDLAHALSTLAIELPPLSERRTDIPQVAHTILEDANAAGEKQLGGFTPEALDLFAAHPWTGDVAELTKVIFAAHAAAEGPYVRAADLPPAVKLAQQAARHPQRIEQAIVLDEYLAEVEVDLIRRALAQSRDNKSKAARLLGLTRPRLYRRMIQLGLAAPADLPDFRPEEETAEDTDE